MKLDANFASGRPHDPVQRGYHVLYRSDRPNYCPGCGQSQWIIGRVMAECARCETALPLDSALGLGGEPRFHSYHPTHRAA